VNQYAASLTARAGKKVVFRYADAEAVTP